MKKYELYQLYRPTTLRDLLEYDKKTYGKRIAFHFTIRGQEYRITFQEAHDQTCSLAVWLQNEGCDHQHIAVLGENSYEWLLVHFATTYSRNVIVPIDRNLSAAEMNDLIQESDCKILFCSDTYKDVQAKLSVPDLRIIFFSEIQQILLEGDRLISEDRVDLSVSAPSKDDLASIVFTSGTTGKSKGVMLTHGNFTSDIYGSCRNVHVEGEGLLVLPLHHMFGLVAGVYAPMLYGVTTYINRSMKKLSQDINKCGPQYMIVVPIIAEQFNQKIWNNAKQKKKDKALKIMVCLSNCLLKLGIDIRYRAFEEIHQAFGGKLRLLVCGGAPMDETIIQSLHSFGIEVLNGYGITECGPVVAVNRNQFIVPESVGLPLECNMVRISDENEILVKGENVMQGYYHQEKETKDAFIDGWFRTGDLGTIDKDGALHILGRIKNLIILKNGENIPAEALESEILRIPFVKEAVVYGKNDVITAEIYLDPEYQDASLHIRDEIAVINRKLPQNRNIADIVIRDEPFPKTTTLKIRRDRRMEHA